MARRRITMRQKRSPCLLSDENGNQVKPIPQAGQNRSQTGTGRVVQHVCSRHIMYTTPGEPCPSGAPKAVASAARGPHPSATSIVFNINMTVVAGSWENWCGTPAPVIYIRSAWQAYLTQAESRGSKNDIHKI